MPPAMKPARRTRAPRMPQNSTRCWYAAGTAKKEKMRAKTKTLSTESDFSMVAAAVDAGDPSAQETAASEVKLPGEETPAERVPDGALPPLRVNRVWSAIPTYTKKQLEAVYERFGVGLWEQFGDRFYSSMRKPEMLTFVQRVVRHHACLDAAQRLTDCQLDVLHDWTWLHLGRTPAQSERYQRDDDRSDPDLRIAARLF